MTKNKNRFQFKLSYKLAACVLGGAIALTATAAPAFASPVSGAEVDSFSLVCSDVKAPVESELVAYVQESQKLDENMGLAKAEDYVNVRSEASEDSEIVGKMENNAIATVEGIENGWYKITSGEISGYISMDFFSICTQDEIENARVCLATVTGDAVKVRSEASTESSIVMMVSEGMELEVLDQDTEGWSHVEVFGRTGYISNDFVDVEHTFRYAKKPEEVAGGVAVANYGMMFTGNPYRYGGSSLTNGTDCSGFVMSVYARFGISLPHSSYAQRSCGRAVSYSEAQPGDIICYNGHVAIYIGNGQIVHAANERKGICVSSATHRPIVSVRRIFG